MNRLHRATCIAAVLFTMSAGGLQAQVGPFIDWILQLSGPGFVRAGLEFTLAGDPESGVLTIAPMAGIRVSAEPGSDADGSNMQLFSLQATYRPTLARISSGVHLIGTVGAAGHVFAGEDIDSFTTVSFPVMLGLRFPIGEGAFRIGGGINLFYFPGDAFDPLSVNVVKDGWEGAATTTAGFELRL